MAPATSTPRSGLAVTQPIIEATLAVLALGAAALSPSAAGLIPGFCMPAVTREQRRERTIDASRAQLHEPCAAAAVAPAR
jgi:hypothetical protein